MLTSGTQLHPLPFLFNDDEAICQDIAEKTASTARLKQAISI
jgi:hypothetical protein